MLSTCALPTRAVKQQAERMLGLIVGGEAAELDLKKRGRRKAIEMSHAV
jgi:hypothetical protein